MRHYVNANYLSDLTDAGPFETWEENNCLTAAERAKPRWKEILETYELPTTDESTLEALTDFVHRRKATKP